MKKRLIAVLSILLMVSLLFYSLTFSKKANATSPINVTISDGYFRGIPSNTTFSAFKNNFSNSSNWNWYIYAPDSTGVYDYLTTSYSGLIGSGYTFSIERSFNNVDSFLIVVVGDVNGDGVINVADYTALKMHAKRISGAILSGAFLKAADLNNDGKVTATDYLRIKRYLAGLYDIDNLTFVTDPTASETTGTNQEKPWYTGWY